MLGPDEIAGLIPHAGSMVLLDEVLDWTEADILCTTCSHSRLDNPLRDEDGLAAVCGIEYGAQAIAVHGGLMSGGKRAGFLVNLKNVRFSVERLDDVAGALEISAKVLHREKDGFIYSFAVAAGDHELVGGRATILLK